MALEAVIYEFMVYARVRVLQFARQKNTRQNTV